MKKTRWLPLRASALVLLATLLVAVPSGRAQAQEQQPLFTEVMLAAADLSADQSGVVDTLRAQPSTEDVRLVRLDLGLLDRPEGVIFNVLPDRSIPLARTTAEERSPGHLSWYGSDPEAESSAVLVVTQNNVIGTIRAGSEIYYVRPVGDGLHAIVEVDETAFPEDHPPEYEELEQEYPEDVGLLDLQPLGDALQDEGVVLTTLVAYTPAVRTALGSAAAAEGLIQVAVDETNQSYANSGVPLRLHLVHTYETAYTESPSMVTDRNRFRDQGDGFMDEVHDLRDAHNADIAVLITDGGGFCGIASAILADEATAFAVAAYGCATGYYTFGHEIGHLLGARHNPEADPSTSPFPYGHGRFNQAGSWRTVMSYNCPGGCTRVPYWSDPLVDYLGSPTGTAETHNNARVLGETAPILTNFRRSTAGADRLGYAWANNPTAASYTPSAAYSYNSAGGAITITRSGTGRYRVRFAGLGGSGAWGGNVQVTAYGGGSDTCKVMSWGSGGSDFVVNVRCFDAAGTAVDTRYTVLVNWPA